jgi:hypothetical protein
VLGGGGKKQTKPLAADPSLPESGTDLFCPSSAPCLRRGCGEAGWTALWGEEFDTLDGRNWAAQKYDGWQYGIGDWGNAEQEWYTARPENVRVEGGALVLEARAESGGVLDWMEEDCWAECRDRCGALGHPQDDACIQPCASPRCDYVRARGVTSGRVRTFGKLAVAPSARFPTVRLEARMQLPRGAGLWPAFWMLPEQGAGANCTGCGAYGAWPLSGEIDIMEAANDMAGVNGTAHYGGPGDQHQSAGGGAPLGSEGFHTFALEWDVDALRWYLDGVEYASTQARRGGEGPGWFTPAEGAGPQAPFDLPFHLVINLAVGGAFTGVAPEVAQTTLAEGPKQLLVDYVRICARVDDTQGALF